MELDYAKLIERTAEDIRFLKKLKKGVDPASCISIGIRRGVPYDNEDVEDDATRRPWRTFSFQGNDVNRTDRGGIGGMQDLIEILIQDRLQSLRFWVKAGAEQTQKICKADAEAQAILRDFV
jgi:hypothetical protein